MYVLHKVRSPAQHNTMNEIYEIQRMYNLCRKQNRRDIIGIICIQGDWRIRSRVVCVVYGM